VGTTSNCVVEGSLQRRLNLLIWGHRSRLGAVAVHPDDVAFVTAGQDKVGASAGLPDGIFAYHKYQFWYISARLGMENVGVFHDLLLFLWQFGLFYGSLVYFMAVWYILWQFGIFYCSLVYFIAVWVYFMENGFILIRLSMSYH
jgi:hypothetical protein